jgi:hypothetical protein
MLRQAQTASDAVDTLDAITRMLAVAHLKLSWVYELPYFIWQVHSPETAAKFLAMFESSQTPQHRIAVRFAEGDLSQDMHAWAAGGHPSEHLLAEVNAYQWCKVDDTWAEATHRDISRDRRRSTFASQAWQSATLRLTQNLQLWDSLDMHGRSRMEVMMLRWRSIGQVVPSRALHLTPRKWCAKAVVQFVYRTGAHALEDWSAALRDVLVTPHDAVPQMTFVARLKMDYVERVLTAGQVFSVPMFRAPGDFAAALENTSLHAADSVLQQVPHTVQYMQLVEAKLRRRKLPNTEGARLRRFMWCPASVQLLEEAHVLEAGERGTAPGHTVVLTPCGTPVVRDLLELTPWRALRVGLRLCAHAAGVVPGTMTTTADVERVCLRGWDMAALDTPALVVLERLVDNGWHVGTPPSAHTLATARTFRKPTNLAHRLYWQCLAMLETLCGAGLSQLLSGQPQQYYASVLTAHRAGSLAALTDGDVDVAPRGGHVLPAGGGTTVDAEQHTLVPLEDVPMVAQGSRGDRRRTALPLPAAKRARHEGHFLEDTDTAGVLWRDLPSANAFGVGADVQVPRTAASSSSRQADVPVSSVADTPAVEHTVVRTAGEATLVDMLEGQPVRVEERGLEGTPGYYRRLCVTCPWHSVPGAMPCRARRNTGARQTSVLGVHEPLAYLGAWLAAGVACTSRDEHIAFKPTMVDTQAYAESHGLI